ncbi:hypothetical protein [Sphingomonas crusticola]|uniref:hypothetical protein n=1 Tax=Sphingomonas crusticola TaxID=1697973 RepID=UPI000E275BE5|nr:hypothetical protein [Sphingomonas crusticola]
MVQFLKLLPALVVIGVALPAGAAPRISESGEAKLAKALEGRIPGKPVDCISLRGAKSSQVYDGTAIVYEDGRTLYVNRPAIGAESLRRDDILVSKTYSDRLCRIDTIRLVDQGSRIEHGFVGLGQFVPYTKPKS